MNNYVPRSWPFEVLDALHRNGLLDVGHGLDEAGTDRWWAGEGEPLEVVLSNGDERIPRPRLEPVDRAPGKQTREHVRPVPELLSYLWTVDRTVVKKGFEGTEKSENANGIHQGGPQRGSLPERILTREDPSFVREDPFSDREDPFHNREDPSSNREDPSSNRQDPSSNLEDPFSDERVLLLTERILRKKGSFF